MVGALYRHFEKHENSFVSLAVAMLDGTHLFRSSSFVFFQSQFLRIHTDSASEHTNATPFRPLLPFAPGHSHLRDLTGDVNKMAVIIIKKTQITQS